nr:MAG: hypothetical protein E4H34_02890 [Hyphomicrobiales bacterium]
MIVTRKSILLAAGAVVFVASSLFVFGVSQAAIPILGHALFATSDKCVSCHSTVHAPDGEDISIGYLWRASMMANSARDPYWHAAIRRETLDHPAAKAAIEDKCSTCHMPMQRFQAHAEGNMGEVLSYLESVRSGVAPAAQQTNLDLSMDGVSCTVCHQISDENFGREESFDGGFVMDVTTPFEQRKLFGKYDVDNGRSRVMHSATGFTPTQSDHLAESELCASCHTLYTNALDNLGNPVGVLPEQVPYAEWLQSSYAETDSCQSCHMPKIVEDAPLTSTFAQLRAGVSRHSFVGGNAFMLRILGRYRDELGVVALASELEAGATRAEQHLATKAANIAIENIRNEDGRIEFEVALNNFAGHKLPTAYPSRRVWLHVVVRDANGAVVFESGKPNDDGSITGNDNDADRARFEPHYQEITAPDQVQIYESIMGNYAGEVTTGLVYGARYLKDNRIPPRGFEKSNVTEEVAVIGGAMQDSDFAAGTDRVRYSVDAGALSGNWTVLAELLYQSIGYRWAANLKEYESFETQRFGRYFDENAEMSTKFLASVSAAVQ